MRRRRKRLKAGWEKEEEEKANGKGLWRDGRRKRREEGKRRGSTYSPARICCGGARGWMELLVGYVVVDGRRVEGGECLSGGRLRGVDSGTLGELS